MVLYCCWIIGKFFTLIHLMWAVCKLVLALCLVEVFRSSNHPPWGSHGVCVTSLTQWRASRGPPILRQLGWRLGINYRWTTHCHLFAAAVFSFQIRLWFVLLLRPSWCAPMIFLRVLRGSSLPSRRPLSLGWARPLSRRWLLWAGWPLHLCPSVQGGHRGGELLPSEKGPPRAKVRRRWKWELQLSHRSFRHISRCHRPQLVNQ